MDSELNFWEESENSNDQGESDCDSERDIQFVSSDEDSDETQHSGSEKLTNKKDKLVGRDGTQWEVFNCSFSTGTKSCVSKEKGGPTAYACQRVDRFAISAFRLLFDEQMLRLLKKYTDSNAQKILNNPNWSVSLEELESMIAVMYVRGVIFSKVTSVDDLWSYSFGTRFIKETMTRGRFKELLRFLRFDEKSTRSGRFHSDKFALISEIWDKFIENCQRCYRPGENMVIDEQLLSSKAKRGHTQHVPDKFDKFRLKFWVAADVETKYLCNAFPYLEKEETRPKDQTSGEYVVFRLMAPFLNQGRNLTADNFFTSLKLAKKLREKGTSIVGKVNKIRPEIPEELKKIKAPVYSTKVLRTSGVKNCTLTLYQAKKNKSVLILSTLHQKVGIGEENKKIPETFSFYNSTKCGVDVLDRMRRRYTTKVPCRRWPLQAFYNILDFAAVNAWILYKLINEQKIKRKTFILTLAEELRKKREKCDEGKASSTETVTRQCSGLKRRKCQVGFCKNNKSKCECQVCGKRVCGTCQIPVKVTCKKCSD